MRGCHSGAQSSKKPTYLLENALVFDGTGSKPKEGSVLIVSGKVAQWGYIPSSRVPQEAERMDLRGLAVSPGFINIHSHSDTQMILHPECKTLLAQGITTEVIGNCGGSDIDTSGWSEASWQDIFDNSDVKEKWDGVRGYLDAVRAARPAANTAALFGHGDVRRRIVGDDGRPMTPDELKQAEAIAQRWMEEGAFGVSSGLEYVPGRFANVEELAAVSRPVRAFGGFHACHMRNEGPDLLRSIQECIDVTAKSGVRFEVSHIKACGPDNWGKVREALEMLDNQRAQGLEMTADFYPYLASSTGLAIVLPDWVLEKGKQNALEGLRQADFRRRAEEESDRRTVIQGGWDRIVICAVKKPENKWMEGKNLGEIAASQGKSPVVAAIDLLLDENLEVRIARFAMSEEDMITALTHPETCVVTDGSNTVPEKGKPHPRSVGTFPRVLGRYAREKGVISMEEAVRKMTSLPARRLGLTDRGLVAPGYWADLVVFDPDTIADKATYEDPWQYPVGIFAVFVNGEMVVKDGELTGARPGMALSRRPYA